MDFYAEKCPADRKFTDLRGIFNVYGSIVLGHGNAGDPGHQQSCHGGEEELSFAQMALATLQRSGFPLAEGSLTRAQAAEALYLTHQMNNSGLGVFTE